MAGLGRPKNLAVILTGVLSLGPGADITSQLTRVIF